MIAVRSRGRVAALAEALIHSWWTVVAGSCLGLAASHVALSYAPGPPGTSRNSLEPRKVVASGPASRSKHAIEPAPPASPGGPAPATIYGLGLAAGLLGFVGPVVVRRLFSSLVFVESELRRLSDAPILACVHRIRTSEVARQERRRRAKNLVLSTLSAAVLVAVVLVF